MTYTICEPCIDVKDRTCVDECPVDCIYEGGRMLYIQPDECVDCGACEPVCPVTAILYEDDVPAEWKQFTPINAEFFCASGIAIRIHVNGTRGKSSVTRLIAAALRDHGVPTVAKTTGTSPLLILPDGTEVPVQRDGPPKIRELIWAMRRASRLGARAVVFECM